jgi:hypothetical protein
MLEAAQQAAELAGAWAEAAGEGTFLRDRAMQQAVSAVGDSARRVSGPARQRHPGIPWDALVQEADTLRAQYDTVDIGELRRQVLERFPGLVRDLEEALRVEAAVASRRPEPRRRAAGPAIALPRHEIEAFCRRNHIKRLSLFGSVLREDFSPKSDVDVLVEFAPGHTPGLAFFLLEEELAAIIGRGVDLVTRGSLSPHMRERVLAQAEDVFVAA